VSHPSKDLEEPYEWFMHPGVISGINVADPLTSMVSVISCHPDAMFSSHPVSAPPDLAAAIVLTPSLATAADNRGLAILMTRFCLHLDHLDVLFWQSSNGFRVQLRQHAIFLNRRFLRLVLQVWKCIGCRASGETFHRFFCEAFFRITISAKKITRYAGPSRS
jgi:hypothetical protein